MCWPSFRLDLDASGGAAFLLNLCLFIGYAGSLLLYGLSLVVVGGGYSLGVVLGFLMVAASLVAEQGL